MRASEIFRLARTSRWARVASGTRNALAISTVVSPPRVRRVRATCGLRAEGRVAAGEDQAQQVVGKRHGRLLAQILGQAEGIRLVEQRVLLLPAGALPAALVDQLAVSGGGNPGGRILRDAPLRPHGERGGERFLERLLRTVEGAADTDQRRSDPARLLAEQGFRRRPDVHLHIRRGRSAIGRTSMHPAAPLQALGMRLAHSMASSRLLHSMM